MATSTTRNTRSTFDVIVAQAPLSNRPRIEIAAQHDFCSSASSRLRVADTPIRALPLLVDLLAADDSEEFRNSLRSLVLRACLERNLPLPQITPGMDDGRQNQWIG